MCALGTVTVVSLVYVLAIAGGAPVPRTAARTPGGRWIFVGRASAVDVRRNARPQATAYALTSSPQPELKAPGDCSEGAGDLHSRLLLAVLVPL